MHAQNEQKRKQKQFVMRFLICSAKHKNVPKMKISKKITFTTEANIHSHMEI